MCVICRELIADDVAPMPILIIDVEPILFAHPDGCYDRSMKRVKLFIESLLSDDGWISWLNSRLVQPPLGGLDCVSLETEEKGQNE